MPKLGFLVIICMFLLSVCLTSTKSVIAIDNNGKKYDDVEYDYEEQAYIDSLNQFYFKDYQVDFYLDKTVTGASKMRVREEFTAVFSNNDLNHGFNREIPFTNNGGQNLTMASDNWLDIEVTRNGVPEPINDISVENNAFIVQIGSPDTYVHGEQVYVLEYEFVNVITDFGEYQELYWDTNGTDSMQQFRQVTARVHFGEGVAELYDGQKWCYAGDYGMKSGLVEEVPCQIRLISDGLEFTTENLKAHQNLTLDIQFLPYSFVVPAAKPNYLSILLLGVEILWLIVMVVLFMRAYRKIKEKRQFYKGYFVKPEYTVPPGLNVLEAEKNYLLTPYTSTEVAALLELAVNHKIELVDKTPNGKKDKQWYIRIKDPEMASSQRKVIEILAGRGALAAGQEIKLKRNRNTTQATKLMAELNKELEQKLEHDGYLERDVSGRVTASGAVLVLGMIGGTATFFDSLLLLVTSDGKAYAPLFGGTPMMLVCIVLAVGIFSLGIVAQVLIHNYETHTKKGLELSRYLDGLKLYISMAEAERLQMFQSVTGVDTSHQGIARLYEKLLPYAVIFGLEKSWLKELSKYYEYSDVSQPDWYRGIGVFNAATFISDFNDMKSTAVHSFSTSTGSSSSGSSGGGGGGFSGGGGGGGGTSGW